MLQIDKAKAKMYSKSRGWETVELIPKPFVWKKEFEKKKIKFLCVSDRIEARILSEQLKNQIKINKVLIFIIGILIMIISWIGGQYVR